MPRTRHKLDEKAAYRLLASPYSKPLGKEDVAALNKLVADLDGLPLALAQAASYMRKYEKYPAAYLKLLAARSDVLHKEDLVGNYNPGLDLATILLLDLAEAIAQEPAAGVIAHSMAYLAPDNIPETLLRGLVKDEAHFLTAIALLEGTITTTEQGYSIHRVRQEVLRAELAKDKSVHKVLAHLTPLLTQAWSFKYNDLATWPVAATLAPHVQALWSHVEDPKLQASMLSTLNGLGDYFNRVRSALAEATNLLLLAVQAGEQLVPKSTVLATSYNNWGDSYYSQGDYAQAIEFYNKALQIFIKALGENHPDVASSYNNLGASYHSQGHYDKAINYFNKVLQILLKVLGENHPNVASSYNNLGLAYDHQGHYDKAIQYHNKALQIKLKVLGTNHPDVATSYFCLGSTYYNKQDSEVAAIHYLELALVIYREKLGETHPDTKATKKWLDLVRKAQAKK